MSYRHYLLVNYDIAWLVSKMKDARSTDGDPYAGMAQMIVVQNWFQELNAPVPVE